MTTRTLRILIVDDDSVDRMAVSRALDKGSLHAEIEEAATAQQAEEACARVHHDVVILDMRLPDRDGMQVLKALRASGNDAAIVMLTGFGDEETAAELIRAGASEYLSKSALTPERLQQRLDRALRTRSAELAVRRHDRQLKILAKASLATHGNVSDETVPRLLVEHACALIDARTAATTLLPAKAGTARHTSSPQPLRPPSAGSLPADALETLQKLKAPQRLERSAVLSSAGHQALLAAAGLPLPERELLTVPMIDAQGQLLGVLQALDPSPESLDGDLAMLDQLAQLGALALQNARLFRELQEASRARDELMAIVSHDLRNPISVVVMSGTMLLRSLPDDEQSKAARTQVTRILRASQQMTQLVGDLLDASRIEEGKLTVEPLTLPAEELIDEAIEAFAPIAQQKGVQLSRESSNHSLLVTADRARILQVFSNLLGNAFKFTPRGGAVTLSLRRDGPDAALCVKDTGQGIPPEHLPKLFDRFWQPRSSASQGAGLGLFIAKGIVEAHGGRLWVKSVPAAAALSASPSRWPTAKPNAPSLRFLGSFTVR